MDIQQILSDLHSQRSRLDRAIAALEGLAPRPGRPPKKAKRKTMSLAARKRIGAAKKAWWAKQKGKTAPKKSRFSAAARKRLSALMIARWAKRRKAAK
jgi:hypothetical protein